MEKTEVEGQLSENRINSVDFQGIWEREGIRLTSMLLPRKKLGPI